MKTIRILLADDHTVVRKGLRLLLEGHPGFTVVADAADGRAAVALAEQHTPDVVVMDVAMPGMDGIAATAALRRLAPRIAVVIHTLHDDAQTEARARAAGAVAFVAKRGAADALLPAIRQAVGSAGGCGPL